MATIIDYLKRIPSGIGLDVAKRHTGIFIWDGSMVHEHFIAIKDYDKNDPFAEYRMRREFKRQLGEIVAGKNFSRCVIENVYGGVNFDTVRKLLALNTVIDELIFDQACTVDKFYRWEEAKWLKYARMLYKQPGRLNTKVEIQGILNHLGYSYSGECAEDVMDAAGILLGVIAYEMFEDNQAKNVVRMSDIKMHYIELAEDVYMLRDKRIQSEGTIMVDLELRGLENSIMTLTAQHPDDVMIASLPSNKLGSFGLKHKFKFYEGDDGYLVFYKKK